MHYIGFDIHKKVISFCEKQMDGTIIDQGMIRATRQSLNDWVGERTALWIGAMEATLFTGWIYDHLLPYVGVPKSHSKIKVSLEIQKIRYGTVLITEGMTDLCYNTGEHCTAPSLSVVRCVCPLSSPISPPMCEV